MPALVVEVVGDTKKLTAGLKQAEAQMKGFSQRASTIKSTGADAMLADVRRMKAESEALTQTMAATDGAASGLDSRFASLGLRAGVAGLAINVLGRNLGELGGNAAKAGAAFSDLSTGNIVGFIKNINSIDKASPEKVASNVSELAKSVGELKDPAKAAGVNTVELSLGLQRLNKEDPKVLADSIAKLGDSGKIAALGSEAAAEGFNRVADAAKDAAAQVKALQDAEATVIPFSAIAEGTFGITPLDHLVGKTKPGQGGLTPEQRRSFFDARIAREVDIARDIPTIRGQVAAYRKIAAEITERIKATDDVTRRFNLEADRRQVNRQATSLLEQAARDQAAATAKATAAQEAAAREAERAAAAAKQEKLAWLDFALEKAEDTKTLADNRKVLRDREALLKLWQAHGDKTLDTARDLWETQKKIRDLGKDAAKDGDPLAGLMQVSSARLAGILSAGTGLSAAGRRVLGANIAGAEIQPMYVSVQIDGREVGRAVTKDQARTGKRTTAQTSGRRG